MYVIMPNFVVIGSVVAEIWRLFHIFFQNSGRPPFWICFVGVYACLNEGLFVGVYH